MTELQSMFWGEPQPVLFMTWHGATINVVEGDEILYYEDFLGNKFIKEVVGRPCMESPMMDRLPNA